MVLDTNAYSALALGKKSIIDTISDTTELKMPLPVIAELRYGFIKGQRPDYNEQLLQRFLAQEQVIIAFPTLKTTKVYAQLQLTCHQRGKVLSHNHLWIAALARELDDTLVTFDRDFEALLEVFKDKLIILNT